MALGRGVLRVTNERLRVSVSTKAPTEAKHGLQGEPELSLYMKEPFLQ